MIPKIYWFRNTHENRNDLLRYGLMQLHIDGTIKYIEKPLSEASRFGFSAKIANGVHKHLSFLILNKSGIKSKIIVDCEDSFVFTSPLIEECDYYFSSGYNADFFEKKEVLKPYTWQREIDIAWYNDAITEKINTLGQHFHKARKFIPIAPNLTNHITTPFWRQKLINAKSKMFWLLYRSNSWIHDYYNFNLRYTYLNSLRNESLIYDVILNDSLWGWPMHRINLHLKLAEISRINYIVNSRLNWAEPSIADGSLFDKSLNKSDFPIISGHKIDNYEKMLASSKLGVFATGFHFGWRNIMTFSLMIGIPVLIDKLKLSPYFDMDGFTFYENEDHDWEIIKNTLENIDEAKWLEIKRGNQLYYDQVMSPVAVANYFLNTIISV